MKLFLRDGSPSLVDEFLIFTFIKALRCLKEYDRLCGFAKCFILQLHKIELINQLIIKLINCHAYYKYMVHVSQLKFLKDSIFIIF